MQARHQQSGGAHTGLRWAVGVAGAGLVGAILLAIAPADASPTTVKAQLALSGVTTKSNPTGGSVIGIHPGDKVSFQASTAPTQGLEQLGLDSVLGGLINGIVGYQVKVDFSKLPGGAKDTVLSGSKTKTFAFPKAGTYNFTWSASRLELLQGRVPINLDGNELAQAGIKLNASNEYVGKVVVAAKPPKGGISVQLPGASVAPSLPVVGQLPTVGVPGVNPPTIGVPSVGSLVPTKSNGNHGGGKHTTHHGSGGKHHSSPGGLTIPEQVVPKGYNGPNIGGGYFPGVLPTTTPLHGGGSQPTHATASSSAAPAPGGSNKAKHAKPIDLAANASPSSSIPVVLAIIAVIALTLVAATYARLYLLRKK